MVPSTTGADESQRVAALGAGDRDAFQALVAELNPGLTRMARTYVSAAVTDEGSYCSVCESSPGRCSGAHLSAWRGKLSEVNETISLRVPAAPAYGRIVRAAGANMATRLGWKAVDIGALRAAIDEAAAALVGEAADGVAGRELTVTFGVDGKAIALAITLDQPLAQPVPADRCTRFETATAGRYRSAELDAAAHRAHIVVNPT